ncbi:hypothetical protein C2869_04790 [Saccharobesus litoralis]|uniref:Plasmid replication protein n=1 Tax=Saccharobesus litoralis TaxID=2172099 RepID=A0A2S0VNL7_9ALTE|nr:hypothetical protein [Saccharobesus litoralis]AWB65796.1 hypothetical protein C2869_04790 [Saccharobesus litoralis]
MSTGLQKQDKKKMEQLQIGLFEAVDLGHAQSGNEVSYSNLIGDIDLIPRYVRGKNTSVSALDRDLSSKLVVERKYRAMGRELSCRIKPALITRKIDHEEQEFHVYPGEREELIERVLFLLGTKGQMIKRAVPGQAERYGIAFTLYQIRQELKRIGKDKSYDQIREALIVIRDSKTTIVETQGGRNIEITNDIFSDAMLETSGHGRGKDRYFVTFSDYVIEQIYQLNYRQYDFIGVNSYSIGLSRFIHSFLSCNWLNCEKGAQYPLEVDEIMEAYGKPNLTKIVKRRDMRAALKLLADKNMVTCVPPLTKNSYVITATKELADEIVLANKKKKGLMKLSTEIFDGERESLPDPRLYK